MNDSIAKSIYEGLHLSQKSVVMAHTHAEFLNKVFGTNYKGWMKTVWPVPNANKMMNVWFAHMDGVSRGGWSNHYHGKIIEEFNGGRLGSYEGVPMDAYNAGCPYRIAVDVIEGAGLREYKILGLYKYDAAASDRFKRIMVKIA